MNVLYNVMAKKDIPADDCGIHLRPLPDDTSQHFLSALIDNVIAAFEVFQSGSMALDYVQCPEKWRKKVLADKRFKSTSRMVRARKYLTEIREIEEITRGLGDVPGMENVDPRDVKAFRNAERDQKDVFSMKLKAAEMRRSLLNLSREDEDKETTGELNIIFTPISREEWMALVTTEVFEGREDGSMGLDDESAVVGGVNINMKKLNSPKKKARELVAQVAQQEIEGGYKVNTDGSLEDF